MLSRASLYLTLVVLTSLRIYGQASLPPGSIDGAVTPEQIPDVVATRLFFAVIAGPVVPNAAPVANPKQAARLLPIGLNAADTGALLRAAGTWQTSVSAAKVPAAAGTAVDLDGLTQSVITSLQGQMNSQGFASFLAYVRSQKKYMQRIPVPAMAH
jgi:hypothetical protein